MALLRRFLESRAHPKNPDAFWINGVTGAETMSGVNVDEDTALSSTAIWNGVRVICETVASVPLNLMEGDRNTKTVAAGHPVHAVLHEPNPELTSLEFREMTQANAVLTGSGYAEIVRDGSGEVVELWPIWPHRIRPMRLVEDGPVVYEVQTPQGERRYLPAEHVLHLRGFSRGGLVGMDVVNHMRESIGLTLALEKYGSAFFGNGSQPGGVLEHPGRLSPEAQKNLKVGWEKSQRGLDKAHRVAILEEGMSWKQMGIAPEAAQAIESRKFQVTEAARILNLPPHMIKDMEHATFSNIEHQFIEFAVITIRPWLVRNEQRYDKQLLLPSERARYFTHHVIEGLLRGDIKSRYDAYAVGRQWGWLSINNILRLEDQNPINEPWANEYMVPMNMTPAAKLGVVQEKPAAPPALIADVAKPARTEPADDRLAYIRDRLQRAQLSTFADAAERVLVGSGSGGEIGAIRAALKKTGGSQEFRVWVDTFYESHCEYVARAFLPVLRSCAEAMHGTVALTDADPSPDMQRFVEEYAAGLGNRWAAESLAALRDVLRTTDPEGVREAVSALLAGWEASRAHDTATDEVVRAGAVFVDTALAA